ncbi:MAG: hypothetical protein K940chlam7_01212 [Chlamydiae bacterium]|nr:hypothetical protein [Chlamydiota bacterium]
MTNPTPTSTDISSPVPPNPSPTEPKTQSKWREVLSKIWGIAKKVLFGLAGAGLFFINPTLFAIGFVIGIIWDKKVQEVIERIKTIWKMQTWSVLLLTSVASVLSIQVTLATASTLFASNLGSLLSHKAREHLGNDRQLQLI